MPKRITGRDYKDIAKARVQRMLGKAAQKLDDERPLTRSDLERVLAEQADAGKLTPEEREAIADAKVEALERRLAELEGSP
jgi:hypothetical protein